MAFLDEETAQRYGAAAAKLCIFTLFKLIQGDGPAGWLRAWSGAGDFPVDAGLIDTTGGIYTGAGDVVGLPVLSQLINGVADRVEFILSGASPTVLALADSEADTVRGAAVHVGLVALDEDLQALSQPLWFWEGRADVPRVARTSQVAEDGASIVTRSVSLSVGTLFTRRRRPRAAYFTGVDQRRRSPTDKGCDRANKYNLGATRKWP